MILLKPIPKVKLSLIWIWKKGNMMLMLHMVEMKTIPVTTQKLTIKKEVIEQPVIQQPTQSSSSSNEIHYDEEINVYYDDSGKIVDPDGKHPQGVGDSYSEARELREMWERGEDI